MVFDRDVLAFDVAGIAQTFAERGYITRGETIALRRTHECHDRHRRLLRPRSERPNRRAAEQRDERAPPHSITSSAPASSVGGTSKPSVFAVLRLIIRSNFVGRCTGKSAGLAPLR